MAVRRNISPKTSIWIINTENTGSGGSESNEYSYILPVLSTGTYNFTVEWGDGNQDLITNYTQSQVTHSYSTKGEYQVLIDGTFDGFNFSNNDRDKIVEIRRWGQLQSGSIRCFNSCANLISFPTQIQNSYFPYIDNTKELFAGASQFNGIIPRSTAFNNMSNTFNGTNFNQPLNHLDVSGVGNMSRCFQSTPFNQPIGNWDVSNVTSMYGMFYLNSGFNNGGSPCINNWNVSNVTNMGFLFPTNLNQPLDKWKPTSCSSFRSMFGGTFDQDLSSWSSSFQASNISMERMFGGVFNNGGSPNINDWDVSNVTNMSGMFRQSSAFNQPLNDWDVSNVTNMRYMFYSCDKFNQPLDKWRPISCSNFRYIFGGDPGAAPDLSSWDIASWSSSFQASNIDMVGFFHRNATFSGSGIGDWDVSNVTDMTSMFFGAHNMNEDLSSWDTSNVTSMAIMFQEHFNYNQPLNSWDVSNVTSFYRMFWKADAFNQPLNNWDTGKATTFEGMFTDMTVFNQTLGSWNIQSCSFMAGMLDNTGLSRENYEDTLISWSLQAPSIQSGVALGASGLTYSGSLTQVSASRAVLINDYGWTISGDINVG